MYGQAGFRWTGFGFGAFALAVVLGYLPGQLLKIPMGGGDIPTVFALGTTGGHADYGPGAWPTLDTLGPMDLNAAQGRPWKCSASWA